MYAAYFREKEPHILKSKKILGFVKWQDITNL